MQLVQVLQSLVQQLNDNLGNRLSYALTSGLVQTVTKSLEEVTKENVIIELKDYTVLKEYLQSVMKEKGIPVTATREVLLKYGFLEGFVNTSSQVVVTQAQDPTIPETSDSPTP